MRHKTLVLIAAVFVAAGCVERELTIVSEPQGARVYYNHEYVGEAPVTFHFTHYQAPYLRLEKEGYETLSVVEPLRVPLYQRPGFDFLAEVLTPWTFRDHQEFAYELALKPPVDEDALLERAGELAGETLGD